MKPQVILLSITAFSSAIVVGNGITQDAILSDPQKKLNRNSKKEDVNEAFYTSASGVKNLGDIFKYIKMYQLYNNGSWPEGVNSLRYLIMREKGLSGYEGFEEAGKTFLNPDARYSGNKMLARGDIPPYIMPHRDIRSGLHFGPRPIGAKDVICYTDIYHVTSYSSDSDQKINPQGGILLLEDDGTIEKVAL